VDEPRFNYSPAVLLVPLVSLLLQGKPYFQTDFGIRHEIYGVEANVEFVGNVFGSRVFYLGGYQNIGTSGFQYQLRLIPKLDYSVTERGGVHTTRKEGDVWFRLGGTGSLDFRLGLQTFNALDAGVSYQFLETVSGSGGYSYLFKAHTTLWLIENVGVTLEYSKGDTPVADKPIDLITFGTRIQILAEPPASADDSRRYRETNRTWPIIFRLWLTLALMVRASKIIFRQATCLISRMHG